jgi:transposase
MLSQNFVSKDRISGIIKDLTGVTISDTSIIKFENDLAQKLRDDYETIKKKAYDSEFKHLDESGLRVLGKLNWLHVLSCSKWTYYHLNQKRGYLLEDLKGNFVHDHWKKYFTLKGRHILCKAHILREIEFFVLKDESWAKSLKHWLRYAQLSRN